MKTPLHHYTLGGIMGFVTAGVFLSTASMAFAEGYTPMVTIPGVSTSGATDLPTYINQIYLLTISVGALIGVIKIAFAGVKYSMSDVVTNKESAKEDIKGVLLGLAILLIPFIVLYTINPDLTKLDVLKGASATKLNMTSGSAAAGNDTTNKTGTQVFAIENCVTGGGDYVTGCAKSQCDAAGGTLSDSSDPAYSTCTVTGVYTDP